MNLRLGVLLGESEKIIALSADSLTSVKSILSSDKLIQFAIWLPGAWFRGDVCYIIGLERLALVKTVFVTGLTPFHSIEHRSRTS